MARDPIAKALAQHRAKKRAKKAGVRLGPTTTKKKRTPKRAKKKAKSGVWARVTKVARRVTRYHVPNADLQAAGSQSADTMANALARKKVPPKRWPRDMPDKAWPVFWKMIERQEESATGTQADQFERGFERRMQIRIARAERSEDID